MYDLQSFSPEFLLAEGEPYDRSDLALNKKGQPISLYSAISKALESEKFRSVASKVFEVNPDFITADLLYESALIVNACRNLSTPVQVYLDIDCNLTVSVYDDR